MVYKLYLISNIPPWQPAKLALQPRLYKSSTCLIVSCLGNVSLSKVIILFVFCARKWMEFVIYCLVLALPIELNGLFAKMRFSTRDVQIKMA